MFYPSDKVPDFEDAKQRTLGLVGNAVASP